MKKPFIDSKAILNFRANSHTKLRINTAENQSANRQNVHDTSLGRDTLGEPHDHGAHLVNVLGVCWDPQGDKLFFLLAVMQHAKRSLICIISRFNGPL